MSDRTGGDAAAAPHVFTVDVEEYFQVHAFDDVLTSQEWDHFPSRVARSTDRLLEILEEADVRGTFFVLGWVADRHPDVVRRIADAGHEVASHSFWHRRVDEMTPEEFREDARRSREILEDLTGERVRGYRAPSFSLVRETEWMLEILVEEGFRYDSSLFPAHRMGGGYPGGERHPYRVDTPSGQILELPLATIRRMGMTLPAAGGAYLRHLPYGWVRTAFRDFQREGRSGVFYIHPWELDPHQPTIPDGFVTRLRHYRNLDRTGTLLERVLGDFPFTSVRNRFGLPGATEGREVPGRSPESGPERPRRRVGS